VCARAVRHGSVAIMCLVHVCAPVYQWKETPKGHQPRVCACVLKAKAQSKQGHGCTVEG